MLMQTCMYDEDLGVWKGKEGPAIRFDLAAMTPELKKRFKQEKLARDGV